MALILLLLASCAARAGSWPWDIAARLSQSPSMDRPAIESALLSEAGAAEVQALFDRAIAQALVVGFPEPIPVIAGDPTVAGTRQLSAAVLIPELSGRAWLVGRGAVFVPAEEPAMGLLRRLAASPEDVQAVAAAYGQSRENAERVDVDHMLSRELKHIRDGVPPANVVRFQLGRVVLSVLENACESYPMDQPVAGAGQGKAIGLWHLHPPRLIGGRWFDADLPGTTDGGPAPSGIDQKVAATAGRNLTLVFRLDGFDVYDVAGGAIVKLKSYRSSDWAAHFEPARARLEALSAGLARTDS